MTFQEVVIGERKRRSDCLRVKISSSFNAKCYPWNHLHGQVVASGRVWRTFGLYWYTGTSVRKPSKERSYLFFFFLKSYRKERKGGKKEEPETYTTDLCFVGKTRPPLLFVSPSYPFSSLSSTDPKSS